MKKSLVVGSMLLSSLALAQDERPHHIISIGTDGFGWSGLGQVFEWDKDKSGIKDHEVSQGNLSLNYHYVFNNGIMLGGEIQSETTKSEIKDTAGDKTKEDESETSFGISVGYNFNDDLNRSWWVKGTFGSGKYESEIKDEDGKRDFEYDYTFFTLSAGKRISLESWGLKNVSYNPSISFSSAKVGGDAEDAGLEKMTRAVLEVIKIDILF